MLWGQLATSFGIPMALTVASVAALVGIALTWKFHLTGLDVDLTPSMHWPTPLVENVDQGRGPVMITVQYGINPEKVNEFLRALSEMRRIRRRDGAIFWEVFRDIKDPSRIIESFMVESWEEHLRQHERITKADVEIEQKVRAFHTLPEPPVVSHLIAEKLADR